VKEIITAKRTFFALVLLAQLMLVNAMTQAQPYQVVNTESSIVGEGLNKTVTTIQEGNNTLDRFFMIKVVKPTPNEPLKAVMLLLPPLGSGFQNYEVGENGDYNNSFVAYFAKRNVAVVGLSPRVQNIAAGSCESGAIDCSPMQNWGLQTMVDDVAYIRQQIALDSPGIDVIIAGLSNGSVASAATLNAHPNDYAGAILIDGTIHDTNPAVRAINANFCNMFEGMLAAGIYYDGQSGPGIKFLSQLAQVAPNQPSLAPGFPPGLSNHQAFVFALSEPVVTPLSPRPGYFNVAGSTAEDRFFFANEELIHGSLAGFVNYATTRSIRDLSCGLAGETTFTNNLGAFDGPVLMFAAGHGFGTAMLDTAQLMASADVTIKFKEEYGHVDFMFSTDHVREVEQPIMKWIKGNF
jgi:pimeloyl-ACP methyl ester carboxylesterase